MEAKFELTNPHEDSFGIMSDRQDQGVLAQPSGCDNVLRQHSIRTSYLMTNHALRNYGRATASPKAAVSNVDVESR